MRTVGAHGALAPCAGFLSCLVLAAGLTLPAQDALAKSGKSARTGSAFAIQKESASPTRSGRSHCGERSYSVSVGNPAFKDRLALWSGPCRW